MERCCDRRVVCRCLNVTEDVVVRAVADLGLRTVPEVRCHTGAGDGCTATAACAGSSKPPILPQHSSLRPGNPEPESEVLCEEKGGNLSPARGGSAHGQELPF